MRVLLLSLYYPPLNTIAALRIKAFEKYLSEQQIQVDVLTRYYDQEQRKGKSMFLGSEAPRDFDQDYIVNDNVIYTQFDPVNPKSSFSAMLPPGVRGLYNYWNVDVFHYGWIRHMMNAFEKEFSKNHYDYIIASYGPPISLLAANILSRKFNIPFMIDFRDSYIDERDSSWHLRMKRINLKRWLGRASGLIFSTEGMKDYFLEKAPEELAGIPSCIVYNGIDDAVPDVVSEEDRDVIGEFEKIRSRHALVLLHTGTLYPGQNIEFFIQGISRYNSEKAQNIAIAFLGLSVNNREIARGENIYILPKVGHAAAIRLQSTAGALLLPIWEGRYTGFSGKTQEYLFSENIVITGPSPQKDLEGFLSMSPNVYIASDFMIFGRVISGLLSGKIEKKQMAHKEKLMRSYWVEKLSKFLINRSGQ